MTNHTEIAERMAGLNPVPDPSVVDETRLAVLASLVEERRSDMIETQRPVSQVEATVRRRKALAFASALILVILVIGAVAFLPGADTGDLADEPAPEPTTITTTAPSPPTTAATAPPDTPAVPATTAPQSPMTWTRIDNPEVFGGDGAQMIKNVAVSGDIAVAVGLEATYIAPRGPQGDANGAVWYSTDGGQAWARVPHDEEVFGGAGQQRIHGVVAFGSRFVAVGFEGDPIALETAFEWEHAGPGDLGPGSAHAAVWLSDDGVTWTRVPHEEAVFGADQAMWMSDVAFDGATLVAVGTAVQQVDPSGEMPGDADKDAVVWTSVDGVHWSRVDAGDGTFGDDAGWQRMEAVATGGPGFVAVGAEGFGLLDVDGWAPDVVAAVWTSVDGATWTRVTPGPALTLRGENTTGGAEMFDVTPIGSGLVAVGLDWWGLGISDWEQVTYAGAAWLSDDGSNWRQIPREAAYASRQPVWEAVAVTADGRLVSGGDSFLWMPTVIWTSEDDGNTWRLAASGKDDAFECVGSDVPDQSRLPDPDSIEGLAVAGSDVIAVGSCEGDAAVWIGRWN